ncbi:MarR family winged helix-turn-helix transcriptional regulator [Kaistia geumhonensis]|uniref:DNA-binding MarR family transcriptional regulator n=1 Tax=Kaistia geumhonensis TaxID=410839 RepID=A0ABU0M9I6_9HYPH|nr:MarR family winged helix-turn-helix transcriptional regulator [Kaistia geumhonensis]MCX5480858.1 MarR family winged helix-turn-helix transcriptional regulator [Kaistia geumhonensis]MDQ0517438.1 DNA-binding MarR family transcriptional regulator [Kaistia geumhonensis]
MTVDIITETYYLRAMENDPPEKHLAFLINDVARLIRRAFDQAAQGCSLTRAQWQVLAFLHKNEGSNQAAVAEALDVEPITLSRHIDRLEALGFVTRLPDPTDRRARRLYLTPAVQPQLAEMKVIGRSVMTSALEGVDETDTERLIAVLTLMRANMARYGGESEPADVCTDALAEPSIEKVPS